MSSAELVKDDSAIVVFDYNGLLGIDGDLSTFIRSSLVAIGIGAGSLGRGCAVGVSKTVFLAANLAVGVGSISVRKCTICGGLRRRWWCWTCRNRSFAIFSFDEVEGFERLVLQCIQAIVL